MTAVAFTDPQEIRARLNARAIGRALRMSRQARSQSIADVALAIWMPATTLARMERGEERNLKLGNALKALDHFGLTLLVADRPASRPPALPAPLRGGSPTTSHDSVRAIVCAKE